MDKCLREKLEILREGIILAGENVLDRRLTLKLDVRDLEEQVTEILEQASRDDIKELCKPYPDLMALLQQMGNIHGTISQLAYDRSEHHGTFPHGQCQDLDLLVKYADALHRMTVQIAIDAARSK